MLHECRRRVWKVRCASRARAVPAWCGQGRPSSKSSTTGSERHARTSRPGGSRCKESRAHVWPGPRGQGRRGGLLGARWEERRGARGCEERAARVGDGRLGSNIGAAQG
eukprot:g59473.t1